MRRPTNPKNPRIPAPPRRPRTKAAKVAARANRPPRRSWTLRFLEFCRQQTVSQLNLCAKYGYDGVQVNYTGRAPQAMQEEEKAQYAARQEAFFSNVKTWNEANSGKVLVFQGNPQNLIDKSVLGECDYIVIPALTATSADKMSFAVLMAAVEDVPTDRFVIGVTTPSLTDLSDESGYFSGYEADGKTRVRATKGAAQWVVSPASGYEKLGISIANAQNDYFNLTLVYKNIREAVDILNPAPKN